MRLFPLASLLPVLLVATSSTANAQRGAEPRLRVRSLAEVGRAPTQAVPVPRDQIGRVDLAAGQRPAILLTGYWPPTNEGVRRFSTDAVQNPAGWTGSDWEGRGYDVYSYFPEFTPPNCISCGQGSGDFEVDYQDTSADFWPIANALQPIAIITFSRGFNDFSWEVEMNQYNRDSWIGDYTAPTMPTPNPPNQFAPADELIESSLPVTQIVNAIANAALGLSPFVCFSGDGGGFLSEFMAYHGVWYQSLHDDPADPAWCVAAGHVHVGQQIPWATAEEAVKVTLREVIEHVDITIDPGVCQPNLGFGDGPALLEVCGEPLTPGADYYLTISNMPTNALGWLVIGSNFQPTPFYGGSIVPVPANVLIQIHSGQLGEVGFFGLTSPGGPATLYVQAAYLVNFAPPDFDLSNAVQVDFLP